MQLLYQVPLNFDLSGKTFLTVDPLFRRLLGRTEPSLTSGAARGDPDPEAPEGMSGEEDADLASPGVASSPDPSCTSMSSAASTRIFSLLAMGKEEEEEETVSPSWVGSSFRRPRECVEGVRINKITYSSTALSRVQRSKFPSHQQRPSYFTNQWSQRQRRQGTDIWPNPRARHDVRSRSFLYAHQIPVGVWEIICRTETCFRHGSINCETKNEVGRLMAHGLRNQMEIPSGVAGFYHKILTLSLWISVLNAPCDVRPSRSKNFVFKAWSPPNE